MNKDTGFSFGSVRRLAGRIGLSLAVLTGGVAEVGQTADAINAQNLQSTRDRAAAEVESTLSLSTTDFQQSRVKASKDLEALGENMAYLTDQFPSKEQKAHFVDTYYGAMGYLGLPDIDQNGDKSHRVTTELLAQLNELKGILETKGSQKEIIDHLALAIISLSFLVYMNAPKRRTD